jgi:hypothetical protein
MTDTKTTEETAEAPTFSAEYGHTLVGEAPDVELVDVSWRVDSTPTRDRDGGYRARFIAYIDARVAAKYLDRWVGPANWEATYEEADLNGQRVLWCNLELTLGDRTVVRRDLTTYKAGRGRKDSEKLATGIKGYVSDAFKRAAASAGIGRNVYALPEVWASVNEKGYPTAGTDAEIAHALAEKAGITDRHGGADPEISAHDASHESETDWTSWAKTAVWNDLDRNDTVAADAYEAALARLGISEPASEADAVRVREAASIIVAENKTPREAEPDPEASSIRRQLEARRDAEDFVPPETEEGAT